MQGFHFFRGDLDQAGDALGRVEVAISPFQERGDLLGTYTNGVKSEGGLRKSQ